MYSVLINYNAAEDCSVNNFDNNENLDNEFDIAFYGEDRHGDLLPNGSVNDLLLSHKPMYKMANAEFAPMWCLIDSNKKFQSAFISELDQFIDHTPK